MAIDPVRGTEVDGCSSSSAIHGGMRDDFCADKCKEKFGAETGGTGEARAGSPVPHTHSGQAHAPALPPSGMQLGIAA